MPDQQHLALGHNHSLILGPAHHTHNLGLGQTPNDHDLDLGVHTHHHDLGLGHAHDHGLALGPTHEHEMALRHTHADNLEENGLELDGDKDSEAAQDHADDLENHDNDLAFTVENHDLGLSDHHELTVVENHDLHDSLDLALVEQNQEMGIVSVSDMTVQQSMLVTPPVLQSRALVDPDRKLTVGQEFPDVHSCRRALRDAAISLHFEMQTVKSDKTRFTAKCASEGCPWRIHAAKLPGVPTFTIRTIHEPHTCGGITHLGHHQASVQWVAESVEQRLRENPNYKPKEILEEIHRIHGIALSYKQAWRGKERIMAAVRGSFEEDYRLLPQYCDQIRRTNPETKILEIEEISQDAAYWIRRIPPRLWATAYFEGVRFGHLTANIAEYWTTWILEASGLPIIQMMEYIRRQLMTWFNERREASMQWTSILVPSAERRVSEAIERAHNYQVLRANEAEFEVISHEGSHIVDIRSRCCSCRGWQLCGLPCAHAVAALLSCRQNVHRFTESCFTVTNYRKAYSQTIHPIPDKTLWKEMLTVFQNDDNKDAEVIINPPKSLKPPGRPRKRRVRSEDSGRAKRVVHCSRCNQTGHFRTTCSAPI
ncbi:hypothetical protein CMV_004056 [Castanea mollissima]|uniref:SWIM-type domain-containing protein n=1 Tax=Castanea mollissima TaxID=60419 RepID=A0A8J4W563_9ROSI|nr:hypothetical protein CMV_004056 [Castanea mollissima]